MDKQLRKNGKAVTKKTVFNVFLIIVFSLLLPLLLGILNCLIRGNDFHAFFTDDISRYFVISGVLFFALMAIESYVFYKHDEMDYTSTQLYVLFLSIALTYALAIIFGNYISVYAMPLMVAGLLLALLVDNKLALYANVLVSVVFFYFFYTVNSDANIYYVVGSLITNAVGGCVLIVTLRKAYTRLFFFRNGILVGLFICVPTAILTALMQAQATAYDILIGGLWALISVILSVALFMVLLPVFESIFHLYSNFRLEELCSPEAPLLKTLAEEAPGTYNHSLAVGNLAQACAIRMGENPTLAKAAAFYHDVGKLKNPLCFTENQKGYNPHDDYIPEVSIHVITEHTKNGYETIKKHRLPDILADIAREHHGTTPVKYFYFKMKNLTEEQLEQEEFCYNGPKPQTKMAALIMIADTVEAATRAQGVDADLSNFRKFVHSLIKEKENLGQFSDCPITYKDLQTIEDTLVEVTPSLYHQRIKYDNEVK